MMVVVDVRGGCGFLWVEGEGEVCVCAFQCLRRKGMRWWDSFRGEGGTRRTREMHSMSPTLYDLMRTGSLWLASR